MHNEIQWVGGMGSPPGEDGSRGGKGPEGGVGPNSYAGSNICPSVVEWGRRGDLLGKQGRRRGRVQQQQTN